MLDPATRRAARPSKRPRELIARVDAAGAAAVASGSTTRRTRDPIPTDAGDAKSIDDIGRVRRRRRSRRRAAIAITQRLVIAGDGKPLVGGRQGVHVVARRHPPARRARSSSRRITRFVPGRTGRGFTDDLDDARPTR